MAMLKYRLFVALLLCLSIAIPFFSPYSASVVSAQSSTCETLNGHSIFTFTSYDDILTVNYYGGVSSNAYLRISMYDGPVADFVTTELRPGVSMKAGYSPPGGLIPYFDLNFQYALNAYEDGAPSGWQLWSLTLCRAYVSTPTLTSVPATPTLPVTPSHTPTPSQTPTPSPSQTPTPIPGANFCTASPDVYPPGTAWRLVMSGHYQSPPGGGSPDGSDDYMLPWHRASDAVAVQLQIVNVSAYDNGWFDYIHYFASTGSVALGNWRIFNQLADGHSRLIFNDETESYQRFGLYHYDTNSPPWSGDFCLYEKYELPTATPTGSPTLTPSTTAIPSQTAISSTATSTLRPTFTPFPTRTPFATRTPLPTGTPTQTAVPSPSPTYLPTFTPPPSPTVPAGCDMPVNPPEMTADCELWRLGLTQVAILQTMQANQNPTLVPGSFGSVQTPMPRATVPPDIGGALAAVCEYDPCYTINHSYETVLGVFYYLRDATSAPACTAITFPEYGPTWVHLPPVNVGFCWFIEKTYLIRTIFRFGSYFIFAFLTFLFLRNTFHRMGDV